MNEILTNSGDLSIQNIWYKILIVLAIGLLIGVERERRKREGEKAFAGIRTYPMISLLGFTAAIMAKQVSESVYIAIFLSFGILVSISYFFSAKKEELGGTTEISMLLVFLLGSLVYFDLFLIAGSLAIIIAILLTYKTEFRTFADKLEPEDIYAAIKFAILSIIILPLLPDQTYGPLDVLNPRNIWYMVVLIAGVSFIGYILFKLMGTKRGIQILSLLGGLASSTAVTLSFTERSKELPGLSRSFAAGILLASTIMFPRVLLVIFVLNQALAESLLFPFAVFTLCGLAGSYFLWRKSRNVNVEEIDIKNPFKIVPAIKFGFVFAAILLISKAAQVYLGDSGLFITSAFAGFADVDAIALSVANLHNTSIDIGVASWAIIIAAIANSITKALIPLLFGHKELKKYNLLGFSFLLAGFLFTIFCSL